MTAWHLWATVAVCAATSGLSLCQVLLLAAAGEYSREEYLALFPSSPVRYLIGLLTTAAAIAGLAAFPTVGGWYSVSAPVIAGSWSALLIGVAVSTYIVVRSPGGWTRGTLKVVAGFCLVLCIAGLVALIAWSAWSPHG